MKAAYLVSSQKIEMRDIAEPSVKPGTVKLKMGVCGVCGSDVHFFEHGRIGDFVVKYPFILGHEGSGTVVEVGEGVTHLKVGDRVAIEPGIPCGHCEFCFKGLYHLCPDVQFFAAPPVDGCLMDYVVHPAEWCFKLPDNMSLAEGALVEPAAVGINGAVKGGVSLGDDVLVFGAGCIGLVTLTACQAYGATRVIVVDIVDKRLETAREMGAITINSAKEDVVAKVMELTGGKGVPVVIDCVGANQTVLQGIDALKPAGTFVLVGLAAQTLNNITPGSLVFKNLTLKTVHRYHNMYPTTIAAISAGKLNLSKIVSNVYKFEDTHKAFAETVADKENIVKSVIEF